MNYFEQDYKTFREDPKEGSALLANFVAEIVQETRFIDGINDTSNLVVKGKMPNPRKDEEGQEEWIDLPEIEITGDEFAAMKWTTRRWGIRCVIYPGGGVAEDLRTHMQTKSHPPVKVVYKQTGWELIDKKRTYLHVGGGITKSGNNPAISVVLPPELSRYDLTCPHDARDCVAATLRLLSLTRQDVTWPLLSATLAPLYGQVDFACHVAGRTGSFKSELCSLFQSHYGAGMDARHLPGSWSSTSGANLALAFYARNAAFVLDDFVPNGTSWQQKQYQQSADAIIRSQGNQSGRARLTDTSRLQQTMYPRGLILSTGEDTPEGHSVRARMMVLEISPGEIDPASLTEAQAARPFYCGTVAWLAQELAGNPADLAPRANLIRDENRDVGHSRTPGMMGRMIAVAEHFLATALGAGFIDKRQHDRLAAEAASGIAAAAGRQSGMLEDADPVDVFMAALRQTLATGGGHLRLLNGGTPVQAPVMGWEKKTYRDGMDLWAARGQCLGWIKPKYDELYLDMTGGYSVVKRVAGADVPLSKQTLMKRMKEAGWLLRTDDGRGRNTVRVVADGHSRQALCLSLAKALDLKELKDDDGDDGDDSGQPAADDIDGGDDE